MKLDRLLQEKRTEILHLAARHGARNVRVFGSIARGEAKEDSDVDFLVEVASEHSSWFPAGLILDMEELLGRKVEVVTEGSLHHLLRPRIVREAVPL